MTAFPLGQLLDWTSRGLWLVFCLVAPILLCAALAGAAMALVQRALGSHDPAAPTVARLLGGLLGGLLCAPWMVREFTRFSVALFGVLPNVK
jgi:flagellar biosynthesis protein FliQ